MSKADLTYTMRCNIQHQLKNSWKNANYFFWTNLMLMLCFLLSLSLNNKLPKNIVTFYCYYHLGYTPTVKFRRIKIKKNRVSTLLIYYIVVFSFLWFFFLFSNDTNINLIILYNFYPKNIYFWILETFYLNKTAEFLFLEFWQ